MKPWVQYSLVRVGLFAVVFALLTLINPSLWWLWAIAAAIVSLCISYIFFGKLRDAVALDIVNRRAKPAGAADTDAAAEDAEADSVS